MYRKGHGRRVPKLCITTVATANAFQYYIPMFVYSAKLAYPTAGVKVFVKGKLSDDVVKLLQEMKNFEGLDDNWSVYDDSLKDFPTRWHTPNAIRFLIPPEHYKGYKYVYVTDVDFLMFEHAPSLLSYYRSIMKRSKNPYAACRSAILKPYRKKISVIGWKGDFTRLVGGGVMLKNPEWYKATKKMLEKYRKLVKSGKHDKMDTHRAASYREYDEVMLYRICALSGLNVSKRKYKFADNTAYKMIYRDVHLGDFKFGCRRRSISKMQKLLKKESMIR